MAISASSIIASSSSTDATSYNTESVSPTANRLYLLGIINFGNSPDATEPTVTGASMTWTKVVTLQRANTTARVTIFRSLSASPGTGALTIDFGGVTQANCGWHLSEFTGIDTSGTNGSGAIVQSGSNEAAAPNSSLTVTLSAMSSTDNASYGVMREGAGNAVNEGSGFTELSEVGVEGAQTQAEWKLNDNTVDWSYSSSAGASIGAACEIKVAGAVSSSRVSRLTTLGCG